MKQPDDGQNLAGSTPDQLPAGDGNELERLRAEVARLREQVRRLEKERDDYKKVAYAWALEQVTVEDIEKGALEEEGEPLEAFLPELERILRGEAP